MNFSSVRTRLTLWNVGVLALILTCFAGTIHYVVRFSLIAGIDKEVAQRRRFERFATNHFLDDRGYRPDAALNQRYERPESREWDIPVPAGKKSERQPFPWEPNDGQTEEGRLRRLREEISRQGLFDLHGYPLNRHSSQRVWDKASFTLALKGESVHTTATIQGVPFRNVTEPVYRGGKPAWVHQTLRPLDELEQLMSNLDRTLIILILPALGVAGLSGAFLTARSIRPVRRISQATSQLAKKDLSFRLKVTGKDEFSELAENFNRMAEQLEEAFGTLEKAYQRQQRFTADASHELRTPLTAILANASLTLSGDSSKEEYQEAMEEVDTAAKLMKRIVDDLLFLARSDNDGLRLDVKTVPARQIFEAAASDLMGRNMGVLIRIALPHPDVAVTGDPHHLERLLRNLLENSARHTHPDGCITLSAEAKDSSVVLKVEDTGEGIAAEHLTRVFDRFYRVDNARSRADGGAGLGLSICQSIAHAHSGSVTMDSHPGEGTTVTVILPGPLSGAGIVRGDQVGYR